MKPNLTVAVAIVLIAVALGVGVVESGFLSQLVFIPPTAVTHLTIMASPSKASYSIGEFVTLSGKLSCTCTGSACAFCPSLSGQTISITLEVDNNLGQGVTNVWNAAPVTDAAGTYTAPLTLPYVSSLYANGVTYTYRFRAVFTGATSTDASVDLYAYPSGTTITTHSPTTSSMLTTSSMSQSTNPTVTQTQARTTATTPTTRITSTSQSTTPTAAQTQVRTTTVTSAGQTQTVQFTVTETMGTQTAPTLNFTAWFKGTTSGFPNWLILAIILVVIVYIAWWQYKKHTKERRKRALR